MGCESTEITELTKTSGKNVFSFDQKVDEIVAANLISLKLITSISFANKLLFRLMKL